jgi:DNA polymerase
MRVPYHIVVEPDEYDSYARVINPKRILVLPENFSKTKKQGSIPVRNWIWDHAISTGAERHWILDDNINGFFRLVGRAYKVSSGTIFYAAEEFIERYENIAFAAFDYMYFIHSKKDPFLLNTRCYSCILIKNDLPYRWRGKYNEDTDLCLRALKDGWCTVLFGAFRAFKQATLTTRGGNTDTVYATGDNRRAFAESLRDQHPDVVKVVERFGRWHHQVDYSRFMKHNKLVRRPGLVIPDGVNEFGMYLGDWIDQPHERIPRGRSGNRIKPRLVKHDDVDSLASLQAEWDENQDTFECAVNEEIDHAGPRSLHLDKTSQIISTVTIDFETYYDDDYTLKNLTPVEFILDDRFEAYGAGVKVDHEPAEWLTCDQLREFLNQSGIQGATFVSHNSLFDMAILKWRFNFVPCSMIDTLGMSRALNGSVLRSHALHSVARHYGHVVVEKSIEKGKGKRLTDMVGEDLFARGDDKKDLLSEIQADGRRDTDLCHAIYEAMAPMFPDSERAVMNLVISTVVDPVLELDLDILTAHLEAVREARIQQLQAVGMEDASVLMSNDKLALALKELGVEPPTKISKTTGTDTWAFSKVDAKFQALTEHPDERVANLVKARLSVKGTIEETRTLRLMAIAAIPQLERKLPVPLRYAAAHTHRLGGEWGINLQNLPSKSKLRDAIVAPAGHVVLVADFSQIEARLVAWLSKQRDMLDAFATGRDIYSEFATALFGRPCSKSTPIERFIGKTAILGMGYGMGAPKFRDAVKVSAKIRLGQKIELSDQEALRAIRTYREKYANVQRMWDKLQNIALPYMAGDDDFLAGLPECCKFERNAIRLPSGLRLFYKDLHKLATKADTFKERWLYNYGPFTKDLWGGALLENICQSLARIIATDAALRLDLIGYRMLMQVHDELVFCVPESEVDAAKKIIDTEMCRPSVWAADLPIAVEIGTGRSYGEAK